MTRDLARSLVLAALVLPLAGCGSSGWFGDEREPWRAEAENQCIRSGRVKVTEHVQPLGEVDGPGNCGADKPFRITAALGGSVEMQPAARLNCPMTAALDDWLERVVQPQAMATFGQPVTEVRIAGSYGCRRINNRSAGPMSEHAYMNALDVAAFRFADGSEVSVLKGWRGGDPAQSAFLQAVGDRSCEIFVTVIGPDGDAMHRDHFHIDLAQRSRGRRYCKGGPSSTPPMMSFWGSKEARGERAFEGLLQE